MPWTPFDKLTPAQSASASLLYSQREWTCPWLKASQHEWLVVDGTVTKACRMSWAKRSAAKALIRHVDRPAPGSLEGWTGGPEEWHLS